MGQENWQKSQSSLESALEDAAKDARASRTAVRYAIHRYAMWAKDDGGPKTYKSPIGQMAKRMADSGSSVPLTEGQAGKIDSALSALYVRSPGQYMAVGLYSAAGLDMAEIAKRYRKPAGRIRELINSGLDYLDGILPDDVKEC